MLTKIKKQFYEYAINELEEINDGLSKTNIKPKEKGEIVEKVFSVSHQLCGTGPMLGFDSSSQICKKLEKIFYDIKRGQRQITPQVLLQTKRIIESLIQTIHKEANPKSS